MYISFITMVAGHTHRTLGIVTLHKIVGRFKFSANAAACSNIEDVQILGGKSPSPEAVFFLFFFLREFGMGAGGLADTNNFLVLTRILRPLSKSGSFPATDTHFLNNSAFSQRLV